MSFSKHSLKKPAKYLFDNCYFKIGKKMFRQIIGFPMGSDPACKSRFTLLEK